MLSWLPRRRARIESIEAEAAALVRDLGEAALSEARRREDEASSNEIARDWALVAGAVARLVGRRKEVDPLARLAMNAILVPDREDAATRKARPLSERGPAEEEMRVPAVGMHLFRIHFLGAAPDRGPPTLTEVEIEAADVSQQSSPPRKSRGRRERLDCAFSTAKAARSSSEGRRIADRARDVVRSPPRRRRRMRLVDDGRAEAPLKETPGCAEPSLRLAERRFAVGDEN